MNSIHCGWGENLLNALGRNYCVSLAGEERGKELVAFWGLERREELLLLGGMNVDKNFFCVSVAQQQFEHIASRCRVAATFWGKQTGNTRTHETQNNLNEYAREEWKLCPCHDRRLMMTRQHEEQQQRWRQQWWLLTPPMTDGQTHTTKQHIYIYKIYFCLSPMIVLEPLKTKVLPKTNKLLKIFPKDLCELCWKVKKQG